MVDIKFVGWYGRGNCGDEAFCDVHRKLFPSYSLEWVTDVTADLASDDDNTVYVLGGGDVFLPYYLKSIPENRKFFVYGVGLGSEDQRRDVIAYKDRLLGVWLRNQEDVDFLRMEGIKAFFTPDIVFNLSEEIIREANQRVDWVAKKRKSVALIVSNNATQNAHRTGNIAEFFYAQYMRITLARLFDELAKYYDVYGLPFSTDRNDFDLGYLYDVVSNMKRQERVRIVSDPLTPTEMGSVVASMDLVVSMKFHGLVFAAASGVPFINIGLTRKTQLICDQVEHGAFSIPAYTLRNESLLALVKFAEEDGLKDEMERQRVMINIAAKNQADIFVSEVRQAISSPQTIRF